MCPSAMAMPTMAGGSGGRVRAVPPSSSGYEDEYEEEGEMEVAESNAAADAAAESMRKKGNMAMWQGVPERWSSGPSTQAVT
jgi:hypothetical protein